MRIIFRLLCLGSNIGESDRNLVGWLIQMLADLFGGRAVVRFDLLGRLVEMASTRSVVLVDTYRILLDLEFVGSLQLLDFVVGRLQLLDFVVDSLRLLDFVMGSLQLLDFVVGSLRLLADSLGIRLVDLDYIQDSLLVDWLLDNQLVVAAGILVAVGFVGILLCSEAAVDRFLKFVGMEYFVRILS